MNPARTSRDGIRSRASARGFTLLELAVALVIALSLLAVALPRFSGAAARVEVRNAAERLAATLREARIQAIAQGRSTALVFGRESGGYAVVGQSGVRTTYGERLTLQVLESVVSESDPQMTEIRFFPDGVSTGGKVLLTAGPAGYAVTVHWLTGRVDVRETQGGEP